jgi:TRAP-type mannitol/chloroaromatic compound transport system permease large subunit
MSKDISLNTVFKGVTYFLPTYIICIILLEIFPSLVMFLAGAVK